jgi:hypothetical protein
MHAASAQAPAHDGLRLLFEIGVPEGYIPTRLLTVLARTCKWFYERARPRLLAGRRIICRIGDSFHRPTLCHEYVSRVIPVNTLWRLAAFQVPIFDDSFLRCRQNTVCTFTNMWLRTTERLVCRIGVAMRRECVRDISRHDYIRTGDGTYAVNLRLNSHPKFPRWDVDYTCRMFLYEHGGWVVHHGNYLANVTSIVLFYRVTTV